MSLETGKQVVDYLLNLYEQNDSDFINQHTKGVVLDFIGGEPLLEAALIERICDYWFAECWRRKIPLGPYTRISFATNGQLWFSPAAQHLFHKYHDLMSVTVSIDGIKELHDKYRLDVNGIGSFDKAWAAFQDGKKYGWLNSKMTFVPDSFSCIYPSIKMMAEQGCKEIHCNYAHEPEYTEADAAALYRELKRVADYLIGEAPDVWVSILGEQIGNPHPEDKNWCGGTGAMLSFAPDGKAYPCIRYAPISVGKELAAPMCLGNCRDGLYTTEQQRKTKEMLDAITLTTQSTQECIDCPVATGCSWCSGFNYEVYGTPNKRVTRICKAHKTRNEIIIGVPNRKAETIVRAVDALERKLGARKFRAIFKSITFDNGTEFAAAESLERSCINKTIPRTRVYYCHPYSSWERGSNEHVNGMIRRRHPKGTDFSKVSKEEIAATEKWINEYPRRIFGYKSSAIMFQECLNELGIAI